MTGQGPNGKPNCTIDIINTRYGGGYDIDRIGYFQ